MIDILIVEDNKELALLLCDFLRAENYTVSVAESGEKALSLYEKYGARLIVLDIMLPGADGFAVCSKIREQSDTPIIIVSAKTEKGDKLNGLIIGADDYIEKPYDIDILLAKIRGIFKRRYALDEITDGNIRLNKIGRTAYINDVKTELTAKEFELLLLLVENKGKVMDNVDQGGRAARIDLESGTLLTVGADKQGNTYTDRDKWSDQNINFGFLRYCFSNFGSEDGYK